MVLQPRLLLLLLLLASLAERAAAEYRASRGIVSDDSAGTITQQQIAPISMQLATAEAQAAVWSQVCDVDPALPLIAQQLEGHRVRHLEWQRLQVECRPVVTSQASRIWVC